MSKRNPINYVPRRIDLHRRPPFSQRCLISDEELESCSVCGSSPPSVWWAGGEKRSDGSIRYHHVPFCWQHSPNPDGWPSEN